MLPLSLFLNADAFVHDIWPYTKILYCASEYAATLPSVCLWIDTEVHQKSLSFTLAETTMSSNCEIHLTTEMINTIETGIDNCLFPIIGIGIGIE